MVFKINVAFGGKTHKVETDSEDLVGTKIRDKIKGEEVSVDLNGYELEVTGTSDKAGFPGQENLAGPTLKKELLTYGFGMKKRPRKEGKKKTSSPKGLRLRKTLRGNEISLDTIQINMKVLKEGNKKFEDFFKEKVEEKAEEKAEEKKE